MSAAAIFVLAFGLAMDAMAAAAARGLAAARVGWRDVALVAALFGGAQAVMPLIGWQLGDRIGPAAAAWDHWIAFVVLSGLGGKMLWEARKVGADDDDAAPAGTNPFGLRLLLLLALATSIDALVAGVTLPIVRAPLWPTIGTIGVVTAVLSGIGVVVGGRLGAMFGRRLDALGGVLLIGLGTKILIEHL